MSVRRQSGISGSSRTRSALLAILLFPVVTASAAEQNTETSPAANQLPPDDCYEQLERGRRAVITCQIPLRLSPIERAELEKGSRGYVKNVDCLMTIEIDRTAVTAAISAADHVFQSPEQPVTCSVTTHKSTFDVTATFAPRVVFRDDVAVEASPGLGNVKGVTRVLSWPVVQFVNRWPSIRKGLLQVVNAYRQHARRGGVVPRGNP